MRILIAPTGFKESLAPDEVADCIAAGILRALPEAEIKKAPLVDGGEGFAKALVNATGGTLHHVTVTGPVGRHIQAHYGFLGSPGPKTAVLEMASAAGLRLVPHDARDPRKTTTYGVGELIKAALDAGAERLLIGCGDSGTSDGGAGMAQALGVRLLDKTGREIGRGGGELIKLERIDLSSRDPRIAKVQIDVACNLRDVLCGPNGTSRLFGPQKGASSKAVEKLAAALEQYAAVIHRDLGIDVRTMPGSGSGGGMGTGLHVFLHGTLQPRYDIIMQYLDIDSLLRETDLVITAEGCLDFQTSWGKIPAEVARRAKSYHVPVIALSGMIGEGARENFAHGIDSLATILEAPTSLDEAIKNAPELLTRAAERAIRMIGVGLELGRSKLSDRVALAIQKSRLYGENNNRAAGLNGPVNVRSDFLAMIAREFRTPLNLITGYAGMVKDLILGEINPKQAKALEQVVMHSRRLLAMINGILRAIQLEGEVAIKKKQDRSAPDRLRTRDKRRVATLVTTEAKGEDTNLKRQQPL